MTPPSRGRRSRAALRHLLVDAGVDVVWEEGLDPGAGNLTFRRVFDRLEADRGIRVTHGSVIGRVWASQRDFQHDVLAVLAADDGAEGYAAVAGAVTAVAGDLDLATPEARWASLAELCRVGCEANLDANTRSRAWRVWTAVWALAMTAETADPAVRDALHRSFEATVAAYRELYAGMGEVLGIRLREPFTLDQFLTLVMALAEGCSIRDLIAPAESRGIVRPTGPGGEPLPWTLFAVGLEALVLEFFEADPAWDGQP